MHINTRDFKVNENNDPTFIRTSTFIREARVYTVELRVLTRVTNSKINFSPKGHSTYASKIPFIDNLKRPACASKQDVLELATLW